LPSGSKFINRDENDGKIFTYRIGNFRALYKVKAKEVMELFFDNPTREWHFGEVIKEAKIARSKADSWLKKLFFNCFLTSPPKLSSL